MGLRRRFWILAIPCALIGVMLFTATHDGALGVVVPLAVVAYLVVVFILDRRMRRRPKGEGVNSS